MQTMSTDRKSTINFEQDMVKLAEKRVKEQYEKNSKDFPTTTQLRKIFANMNKIKNELEIVFMSGNEQSQRKEMLEKLQYFKLQVVYQMAREKNVRFFCEHIELREYIDAVQTKEQFEKLCIYMEAIIAYQKYHGKEK